MAAPTVTSNQSLIASQSLAASGTVNANLDIRTKFEARLQAKLLSSAVAATNGLQIDTFRFVDGGTRKDTISALSFVIVATTSSEKEQSFALPTGQYNIKLTNLDATNAITVDVLYETTDTIV